jgi:hypothetical protein
MACTPRLPPPPLVRRGRASALLALALALPAEAGATGRWPEDLRPADRTRLERADEAWSEALRQARAAGHGGDLAALGRLVQPSAALPAPALPPGTYRCRTVKLGSPGHFLPFVQYGWFRCRVEQSGAILRFVKLTGSQRPAGRLVEHDARRWLFLGSEAWGDEKSWAAYGTNRERDRAAWVERVERARWRIVEPFPPQESLLDLMELVPAR